VHGVLLLDKPEGISANAALQKARRLFAAAKAGHTGTLDPLATGLLPVCFGEATKFSADLLDADKTYEAEVCLGRSTRTGDREGETLATAPVRCSLAEVAACLERFTGDILQRPPMYSALKRDGRPLYELARRGLEVERPLRPVRIHHLELLEYAPPYVRLRVTCSKGTYIRVLAEDIGATLGCGAHLAALRRTRVGPLSLTHAQTLEALEGRDEAARHLCLAPVDSLVAGLPQAMLTAEAAKRFMHGNPVDAAADLQGEVRVYGPGRDFLGLGEIKPDRRLWPRRLLAGIA
jgi:tRNA pseudouridine55 synthase